MRSRNWMFPARYFLSFLEVLAIFLPVSYGISALKGYLGFPLLQQAKWQLFPSSKYLAGFIAGVLLLGTYIYLLYFLFSSDQTKTDFKKQASKSLAISSIILISLRWAPYAYPEIGAVKSEIYSILYFLPVVIVIYQFREYSKERNSAKKTKEALLEGSIKEIQERARSSLDRNILSHLLTNPLRNPSFSIITLFLLVITGVFSFHGEFILMWAGPEFISKLAAIIIVIYLGSALGKAIVLSYDK